MATTFIESGTDATQDLSFYTSTAGTVASATDQAHTGPRSVKLSTGAGPTNANCDRTGVLSDTGRRISFWMYQDAIGVGTTSFFRFEQAGGGVIARLNTLITTGAIQIVPLGATNANGTVGLVANTWYQIVLSYYITNSTTWQMKCYLHNSNGALLDTITANVGTLSTVTSDRISFFINGADRGVNKNTWYDDIYIDDGASSASQPDLPNIRVTSKRPNANGTTNQFSTQIGAGGSGYGTGHSPQVNEQPLSTTNGWSVINAGSVQVEEYNVESAGVGDVNILGQPLVDYLGWVDASSVTSETAQIIVNNATANIALTSATTFFFKVAGTSLYPPGTGTDIGIQTDATVTTVGLYECGIVIAYLTPSTSLLLMGTGV